MSETSYPGESAGPIVQRHEEPSNVIEATYYVSKSGKVRHTIGADSDKTICGISIPADASRVLTRLPDCGNCVKS